MRIALIVSAAVVVVLLIGSTIIAGAVRGSITPTPSLSPLAPEAEPSGTASADPAATTAATGSVQTTTVDGATLLLQLPQGDATGTLVVFADRATSAADQLATEELRQLTSQGWALAAIEGAGTGWGSPASVAAVDALLSWVGEQAPVTPLVLLSSGSGAATSIAAMSQLGLVPSCWLAAAPLTDVAAYAQSSEARQEEVVTAWGETPSFDDLPRAHVAALPTDTLYRIIPPPSDAPALLTDDAASLVAELESTGHDVAVLADDGDELAGLGPAIQVCAA